MLYREIISVCSQIHTKHTNTLCGQNIEFFYVATGGIYSNHWALKCLSPVATACDACFYMPAEFIYVFPYRIYSDYFSKLL